MNINILTSLNEEKILSTGEKLLYRKKDKYLHYKFIATFFANGLDIHKVFFLNNKQIMLNFLGEDIYLQVYKDLF